MHKNELKKKIFEAVDRRASEIIGLGEQILRHPELGFKEVKTARLVEETFSRLSGQSLGLLQVRTYRQAGDDPLMPRPRGPGEGARIAVTKRHSRLSAEPLELVDPAILPGRIEQDPVDLPRPRSHGFLDRMKATQDHGL